MMPLVVVYDQGAVSPTDVLAGVGRPLVVVLAATEHAQRVRPLFAETWPVYDLADPGLVEHLRGHAPSGVQTFSEPMLGPTSALAGALGLPFHDAATVTLLTSKKAQRQRLRDAGVDKTASVPLDDPALWDEVVAQVGLPVVVKPVVGVSSRNTVLVHDLEEGRALVAAILRDEGAVVVEEYLRGVEVADPWGDYVSVESVAQDGRVRHLAVTGKLRLAPPFRECGQFWPARLPAAEIAEIEQLATRAITALGVQSGILHTEVKLTGAGPRVIEVNGRAGGYIPDLARHAAGIDLVGVGADLALGRRVELPPVAPDRVHLQFTTPAPVERAVVTGVCRAADVAGVPGLVRYTSLVRRGATVGGFGTQDLDLVSVVADDHGSLAAAVAELVDAITYRFEIDGQAVTRSARELIYPV
ncbi:ATP-grasp domain-containing protein [Actinokineospora sp. G85]|uniref:ATP-grasp domain-containing protein n=1 Tax=Actinokineospora sp. G85 TaxID=3406626 RepID=UPI003C738517